MNLNATLFMQVLVFFVLAWFVAKFVWPPMRTALDERRQKVADGLAAADRARIELADANKRIEADLAKSRNENQARLADAEKRAAQLIDEARKAAEAEKARILAQAKEEAAQEMVRAKDALRDQVAALVVAGAEQILKREVDAKAHAELLAGLKAKL
ncbi:F0F1 ATP synthase subunit B [Piscinibacterium candidicorallinum]|uniref:ATP synthase subunit b n=1 Tax=Piscinibacterium candidicorallinum TaxID=1793872 RepID=A0ABV7H7R6_9BURK